MSMSETSVWETLDDDSRYDSAGKALPVSTDEGESGSSASPDPIAAADAAKAGTENTTASQPSPGTAPAEVVKPVTTEDKSGGAAAAAKPGEEPKPASTDAAGKEQTPEEEEAAL